MVKFQLTIGEKVINFNVGIGFLGEYQEKKNLDINQVIQNIGSNPFKTVPSLMYESALYASNGELDFTERELIDMIDEDGSYSNKGYVEFTRKLMESMSKDVPEEKNEGDSKKK